MKKNLNDIGWLNSEFQDKQVSMNGMHDTMQSMLDGYKYNFFYRPRANTTSSRAGVPLAQLFVDKLWQHTSEFPKINVPSRADNADAADTREKIVISTHQKNGTDLLWSDWTFDGATMGMSVAETFFDVKGRCVKIGRFDPRRSYFQKSDTNNGEIDVFWTAVPMTKSAIKRKYGVEPTGSDGMIFDALTEQETVPLDNEDYYLVVKRYDAEHIVHWVGNKFITRPYKHLQGELPIDVAMPGRIADYDFQPTYYLSKLKDLQAEFNEYWRRRGNVVRKLGNPLAWGRGIYTNTELDIKEQLSEDGGFVPLKENGELGILTIPETKMIDAALADCFQRMKDIAGFPTATFGEVVGANTSGDALGMYFTPTQKMVNHYNKSYKAFLTSINAKTLRLYEKFGKINEQFPLVGFMPHSSMHSSGNDYNKGRGYSTTFTPEVIQKDYMTIVTPGAVTPKDDIGYKRFILDSVTNKLMSRQTGLDEIGILSPEDEFKRLQEEQSDPMLNPEGASAVAQFDPNAQLQEQDNPLPAGV